MTASQTETLPYFAFVYALVAASLFTFAFLATQNAFLPKLQPFKAFYEADLPFFLKAALVGGTFSALGMIFAGIGFDANTAIAAPTLATAGLLGNIAAGMYLEGIPLTSKISCICLILIVATVLLVDATNEAEGKPPVAHGLAT